MKKQELIDETAQSCGETKVTVRTVLDAANDVVRNMIRRGESVHLFGLGKLSVTNRGPVRARNIHTGEFIDVPAGRRVRFDPSTGLTKAAKEMDAA